MSGHSLTTYKLVSLRSKVVLEFKNAGVCWDKKPNNPKEIFRERQKLTTNSTLLRFPARIDSGPH